MCSRWVNLCRLADLAQCCCGLASLGLRARVSRYFETQGPFGVALDILFIVLVAVVAISGAAMVGIMGVHTLIDVLTGNYHSAWPPEPPSAYWEMSA